MADPAEDDRDAALMRRLYGDGDAGREDGARSPEVESYHRVRGAFATYARATDAEPPARGLDELMAAARARTAAPRPAVAPEDPGWWARLRAWIGPLIAHPALASAAAVVLVAGLAGLLYVRGTVVEDSSQVEINGAPAGGKAEATRGAPATTGAEMSTGAADDNGAVLRVEADPPDLARAVATPDPAVTGLRPERKLPVDPALAREVGKSATNLPGPRPDPTRGDAFAPEGAGETNAPIALGRADVDTEVRAPRPRAPEEDRAPEENRAPEEEDRPRPRATKAAPPPRAPPPPPAVAIDGDPAVPDEPEQPPAISDSAGDAKTDQAPLPKRGPSLDQLTRQARTAARGKDCGVVKTLAGRVRSASPAYYRKTFATDPDIKRCL